MKKAGRDGPASRVQFISAAQAYTGK